MTVASIELHVTSIALHVTSIELHTTSIALQVTSIELPVTSIELHVTSIALCVTSIELPVTSIALHVTSIERRLTAIPLQCTSLELPVSSLAVRFTLIERTSSAERLQQALLSDGVPQRFDAMFLIANRTSTRERSRTEATMTETPPATDPKRSDQVYVALSQRVNAEIATFWARNNLFLVVNSGLLAVGFNQKSTDLSVLILASFGTITSVIWFLVAQRGRAWLRFWENKLVALDVVMPGPKMYPGYRTLDLSQAIKEGRPKSVTSLILPIPWLIILAWFYLAARYVGHLCVA